MSKDFLLQEKGLSTWYSRMFDKHFISNIRFVSKIYYQGPELSKKNTVQSSNFGMLNLLNIWKLNAVSECNAGMIKSILNANDWMHKIKCKLKLGYRE